MEKNKRDFCEELAKEFFETAFDVNEKSLAEFLKRKQWTIYADYEKTCQMEDIRTELDEQGIPYDEKLVYGIWVDYNNQLCDSEDWHNILRLVVSRWTNENY